MTAKPTASCAEVERQLEAYLAGDLAPEAENRVARHLTGCSACAAEAGLAQRVEVELAALPAFDAPRELIERIKERAREGAGEGVGEARSPVVEIASRRRRVATRRLALAAALVAALGLGWWQASRSARPSAAQVAAAEQEARYALALIARVGRKASAEVHREVLVERVATPVLKSMGRSFGRGSHSAQNEAVKSGGLES